MPFAFRGSDEGTMSRQLHLYTPYYQAETFERQAELDLCLRRNCAVSALTRIFLLVDDGHEPPIRHSKITIVPIGARPRYSDWISLSRRNSADSISVLANSDIHLDETASLMADAFADTARPGFIALSRYDGSDSAAAVLHRNPHWSQDLWAVDMRHPISEGLEAMAAIPLGVPRCDNKIAYVFSVNGWKVWNPCHQIRSYHLHETGVRSYDAHVDKRILGGVAYVAPADAVDGMSKIDFDIWKLGTEQPDSIRTNLTIARKEAKGLANPRMGLPGCILAYDHNWQFPAITEQHAFNRLVARRNELPNEPGRIYFAFPWATLFDNLLHNAGKKSQVDFLRQKLLKFAPRLKDARQVVTVCQHIHMMKFQPLFAEAGVTDIFWSHAVTGQDRLPAEPSIRLHPFPLYPVQAVGTSPESLPEARRLLFSFIGAKSGKNYLTQARSFVMEELAEEPDGLIVGNDTWHYNRIVYDYQILGRAKLSAELVNEDASHRYRTVLSDSIFSLCPSGTGPNSIRLWESLGLGSIPVILADTLALPGDPELWRQGAVFCREDRASIRALPERLRQLAASPDTLRRMREAGMRLWHRYGDGGFVGDILEILAAPLAASAKTATSVPAGPILVSPHRRDGAVAQALWQSTTELLVAPEAFLSRMERSRHEIEAGFKAAPPDQQEIFLRALRLQKQSDFAAALME